MFPFRTPPLPCSSIFSILTENHVISTTKTSKADLSSWLKERSVAIWIDHFCSFKKHLRSSSVSRTKPLELNLHINLPDFQPTLVPSSSDKFALSYIQLVLHTLIETELNYYLWQDEGWVKGWTTGEQIRREGERFKRLWKSSGNLTRQERHQPFF